MRLRILVGVPRLQDLHELSPFVSHVFLFCLVQRYVWCVCVVLILWVRRKFAERCVQDLKTTYDLMKGTNENFREVDTLISEIEVRAWNLAWREVGLTGILLPSSIAAQPSVLLCVVVGFCC